MTGDKSTRLLIWDTSTDKIPLCKKLDIGILCHVCSQSFYPHMSANSTSYNRTFPESIFFWRSIPQSTYLDLSLTDTIEADISEGSSRIGRVVLGCLGKYKYIPIFAFQQIRTPTYISHNLFEVDLCRVSNID